MKKQILNIGKALSRAEQKQVFGGNVLIEDGEASSATCYCENGSKDIQSDCSWCAQVCSRRGGYKGVCIEWGQPF